MFLTIYLTVLIWISFVLMLYSAVALIQNKKLFSSAPKDVQDAIVDHEERFRGAHLIGWTLLIVSVLLITFAIVYGAWDGIHNNFNIGDFFVRFIIMIISYKLFDMIFFDWFLLTKSHFFQKYYPETEGCKSYDNYGFNLKSQMFKLLIIFPLVALLFAFICSML